MNILSESQRLHTVLSSHADANSPPSNHAVRTILNRLSLLNTGLRGLETAVQDASEVNDALAMLVLMMDAAYDQRLDADSLRCLLDPLRQKLGRAVEAMREVV